ncbi:MAG: hypothetical protein GPJ51_14380 [Candidatus Heimdallarchaeota archaeon]|nr:hypothetical protein [Candidatus Heimdallarchaeota archaeon]
MVSPIILTLINFLHEIFTIIWIGGMLLLVLVIMPVLKKQFKPEEFELLNKKIRSRLSIFVYISIVVLLITGLILSKLPPVSNSFFSFENTYSIILSIKHILYFLMIAIAVFRGTILDRLEGMNTDVKHKLSKVLLLSNVIFAIAVLFLSSYAGVLVSLPI